MELLKTVGQTLVLILSIGYFGLLGKITYELGKSAIGLHETGFFSLAKYNRSLVGFEKLHNKKK
jgi:hypothetical protein